MKYYGKISDPHDLVTKQYVADNGGKIDSITVNSGSALPIVDKNVDIPAGSIASGNGNFITGGDVYTALQGKQDALPAVTNDRYLHTNATTGALEWSQVDVSSKADKTDLDIILNTATAYTDLMTTFTDSTTNKKYKLFVANGVLGIQEVG